MADRQSYVIVTGKAKHPMREYSTICAAVPLVIQK
jgi:hypothetical protein